MFMQLRLIMPDSLLTILSGEPLLLYIIVCDFIIRSLCHAAQSACNGLRFFAFLPLCVQLAAAFSAPTD